MKAMKDNLDFLPAHRYNFQYHYGTRAGDPQMSQSENFQGWRQHDVPQHVAIQQTQGQMAAAPRESRLKDVDCAFNNHNALCAAEEQAVVQRCKLLEHFKSTTKSPPYPPAYRRDERDPIPVAREKQKGQHLLQWLSAQDAERKVNQLRSESQSDLKFGAKKGHCATVGGYAFSSEDPSSTAFDAFSNCNFQRNFNPTSSFKSSVFQSNAKANNHQLDRDIHVASIRDDVNNLFNHVQQEALKTNFSHVPKDTFNQLSPSVHLNFEQRSGQSHSLFESALADRQEKVRGVNAIEICNWPDDIFEDDEDVGQPTDQYAADYEGRIGAHTGASLTTGSRAPPGLLQVPIECSPNQTCSQPSMGSGTDAYRTTLMISNLPARYTQARLLEKWPADGSYDFLYFPCRFGEHKNFGYAFINFVSHDLATEFYSKWQGRVVGSGVGVKPLVITWASIQGRNQNIKQSLNRKIKRIKNPNFQPAIFEGSVRVDFNKYLEMISEAAEC